MSVELDHLFVTVRLDAPEARCLADAGFVEAGRALHRGQGTACIAYCFENTYLELLWLVDAAEASSEVVRPTGLLERCSGVSACPFGIGVRSAGDELPFEAWDYEPPYIQDGVSIRVARNSARLDEPLVFVVPGGVPPSRWSRKPPLDHAFPGRSLTRLDLTLPTPGELSRELQALESMGLVTVLRGKAFHARLELDGGARGVRLDLRPTLPLTLAG